MPFVYASQLDTGIKIDIIQTINTICILETHKPKLYKRGIIQLLEQYKTSGGDIFNCPPEIVILVFDSVKMHIEELYKMEQETSK